MNIPTRIIKIIESYLNNRKFTIKLNNIYSNVEDVKSGVPQGSALGPLLFSLYINDIPKPNHINTQIALFVDETAIYTKHRRLSNLINNIQLHTTKVVRFLEKWGLNINAKKSEAILFSNKNLSTRRDLNLIRIKEKTIPYSHEIKYLGVYLDKKLNCSSHIQKSLQKTIPRLKELYPIFKSNHSNPRIPANIYKSYIRPVLTYASPVWITASPYNIKKTHQKHNNLLRIAAQQPPLTRNTTIHNLTATPTLEEFLNKINLQFWK